MRMCNDDPSDLGHANWLRYGASTVRLDGVEQRTVFMADEEKGEIRIGRRDENGRLMLDKGRVKVLDEIRRGVVVIEISSASNLLTVAP